MSQVKIKTHSDCIGCDNVINFATLKQFDLPVACFRR